MFNNAMQSVAFYLNHSAFPPFQRLRYSLLSGENDSFAGVVTTVKSVFNYR